MTPVTSLTQPRAIPVDRAPAANAANIAIRNPRPTAPVTALDPEPGCRDASVGDRAGEHVVHVEVSFLGAV